MAIRRYFEMLKFALQTKASKRGAYARKHHVFYTTGRNLIFQPRQLPLYPKLIAFGNDCVVGARVRFCTHDLIHKVVNAGRETDEFGERIGCISIGDRVFVGMDSIIMHGVRIGNDVIVAAGSVVSRDLPSDGVYAGVPAKKICSFEDYIEKMKKLRDEGLLSQTTNNQALTETDVENAWKIFAKQHKNKEMW